MKKNRTRMNENDLVANKTKKILETELGITKILSFLLSKDSKIILKLGKYAIR